MPANRTAFRDEVVETLKELRPGVLRLMESDAGLGSTIDNLLAPPMARERAGYRSWFKPADDIPDRDSGVSGALPGGRRGAVDRDAHGDEPGRDAQAG